MITSYEAAVFCKQVSEFGSLGIVAEIRTHAWHMPSPLGGDFADIARPPTCLEIDFPVLPISQLSFIEGNAGKPVYQLSKWWARRRASIFRAILLAAATAAPTDRGAAADSSDGLGRVAA